jgi:APA family basic amino acid/polyamine antiporter
VPLEELLVSKAPYADTAARIFGGAWGIPVAVLAVISCVGTLNGWTMITGRITQGLAQDGLFPKIFSKVNKLGTIEREILIVCLP